MSVPRKPWEGAVVNTRSSVAPFDSPSCLPLGAGPPRLNALRDRDLDKRRVRLGSQENLHRCHQDHKHRDQMGH